MSLSILGASRDRRRRHGGGHRRNTADDVLVQQRKANGAHLEWRHAQGMRRARASTAPSCLDCPYLDLGALGADAEAEVEAEAAPVMAGPPSQAPESAAPPPAPPSPPPPGGTKLPSSLAEALGLLQALGPEGRLSGKVARAACDLALAPGAEPRAALSLLAALVERHGFKCSVDDARQVALLVGSMSLLKLVILSEPDMQFLGVNVFDKRYPGQVKLNEGGRKRCIKAVLARGARLGPPRIVPTSKLLQKIEADTLGAWVQRYFDSVSAAGVTLPDHVRVQVEAFIMPATPPGSPMAGPMY